MNRSTYGPETITQSLNRVQSEASILFSLPIYSDHFSSCCQFRPRATFRHSSSLSPEAASLTRAARPCGSQHEHTPGRQRSCPDGPAHGRRTEEREPKARMRHARRARLARGPQVSSSRELPRNLPLKRLCALRLCGSVRSCWI